MLYTDYITEHVIHMLYAGYIHGTWLRAGLLPCENLCCTLHLNTVKQSFQKDGPPLDDIPSNKFWKQKDQQFRRCNRNSHISIKSALRVTLTLNIATHFWVWHPNLRRCITMQGLVTKGSAVQKISSKQTLTKILAVHCDLHRTFWFMVVYHQVQQNHWFRRYSRDRHILIV